MFLHPTFRLNSFGPENLRSNSVWFLSYSVSCCMELGTSWMVRWVGGQSTSTVSRLKSVKDNRMEWNTTWLATKVENCLWPSWHFINEAQGQQQSHGLTWIFRQTIMSPEVEVHWLWWSCYLSYGVPWEEQFWFWLTYLNSCFYYNSSWHKYDFLSSGTNRSHFSFIHLNISTSMWWIDIKFAMEILWFLDDASY